MSSQTFLCFECLARISRRIGKAEVWIGNASSSQRLVSLSWNFIGSSKSGVRRKFSVLKFILVRVWCMHMSVVEHPHTCKCLTSSSIAFCHIVLRQAFSRNQKLTVSLRLAGQWAPMTHLSLFSNSGRSRHLQPSLAFYMGTGFKFRSPCLQSKHAYLLNHHLPSPGLLFSSLLD